MSSPPPSSPPPSPPSPSKNPLEQFGTNGLIVAGSALVGLISVFLPAASVSAGGFSHSIACTDVAQGIFGLILYIAAGALIALIAFKVVAGQEKNLLYGLLGAAGLGLIFALWLLIRALGWTGYSLGFGAILNLLAAGGVAAGAFLKAKEEKVF